MKGKIRYCKYFSLRDFLALRIGMLGEELFKAIPRRILKAKRMLDYLRRKDGRLSKSRDELSITLGETKYVLRTKGSDIDVFNQIVVEDSLKRMVELIKTLNTNDLHIVDCGANIGLATVIFKRTFPDAKIICLEPEPGNYSQLAKNITSNVAKDVFPLRSGVWYEEATLSADNDFRDGENWSFALKPRNVGDSSGVPVNSLAAIATQYDWKRIDVLKIDIEGSEFPLFRNLDKWRAIWDTVRIVSLEIHEEIGPLMEIAEVLWRSGFKLEIHGELIIGFRRVQRPAEELCHEASNELCDRFSAVS